MLARPIQLNPRGAGAAGRSPQPAAHERNDPLSTVPTPVILVIEDDPSSRDVLATFVASLGFEVLQAADGTAALAHIEARTACVRHFLRGNRNGAYTATTPIRCQLLAFGTSSRTATSNEGGPC